MPQWSSVEIPRYGALDVEQEDRVRVVKIKFLFGVISDYVQVTSNTANEISSTVSKFKCSMSQTLYTKHILSATFRNTEYVHVGTLFTSDSVHCSKAW
jgi:hypothetical protein